VFLLLALGCDLLLSANLLTNENPDYGHAKRASIIIESTPIKRIFRLERSRGSRNLYASIPPCDEDRPAGGSLQTEDTDVRVHNYLSRAVSILDVGTPAEGNRREAWKSVLSKSLLSVEHE